MNSLTRKFYEKTLRPDRQHSYEIIVDYILKNIKPGLTSVVDYGCGAGWFLYYFKKAGINDIIGCEPNTEMMSVLDMSIIGNIKFLSLRETINLNRKFDLAMNIEVAEHIDEKYSDLVIENITRHVDLLIFSAAVPGQGGYDHVNEQPFEYWENKFNKIGFYNNKSGTKKFRDYLKENNAKAWYINNISIFKRKVK